MYHGYLAGLRSVCGAGIFRKHNNVFCNETVRADGPPLDISTREIYAFDLVPYLNHRKAAIPLPGVMKPTPKIRPAR